jgi:hypothetical protein
MTSSDSVIGLPRVDPRARVGRLVRAYAAFLGTDVGRWIAMNIAAPSSHGYCEPPGAGSAWH